MTLSPSIRVAVCAALTMFALACGRDQAEGSYAFVADEVIADDCGLLASNDALWDGELFVDGDIVRMQYGLFDSELRGRYKEKGEDFYVDGSVSNAAGQARGAACTFELVNIHVEGNAASPTSLTGIVRVTTRALANDACQCEFSSTYTANLAP